MVKRGAQARHFGALIGWVGAGKGIGFLEQRRKRDEEARDGDIEDVRRAGLPVEDVFVCGKIHFTNWR